jgi:hypothetical protein
MWILVVEYCHLRRDDAEWRARKVVPQIFYELKLLCRLRLKIDDSALFIRWSVINSLQTAGHPSVERAICRCGSASTR